MCGANGSKKVSGSSAAAFVEQEIGVRMKLRLAKRCYRKEVFGLSIKPKAPACGSIYTPSPGWSFAFRS